MILSLWSNLSSILRSDTASSVARMEVVAESPLIDSRRQRSPRSGASRDCDMITFLLYLFAAACTCAVPSSDDSSANAVISSGARKKGYDLDKMQSKMIPTAHRSTAVVCAGYLRRTSGGRKPGVPALAAWMWGSARHAGHVASFPEQEQECDTYALWLLPEVDVGRGNVELQYEDTDARSNGVREVAPDISVQEAGSSIVKEGERGREGMEGDSDRMLEKPAGIDKGVSWRGLQRTADG